MILVALLLAAIPAPAQETTTSTAPATETPATAATSTEGTVAIERFEFRYGLEHPQLPPLEQLNQVPIRLAHEGNMWRAPTDATSGEVLLLGNVPPGSLFDRDALRLVAQGIVRWFNARGLFGVWVAYSSEFESSSAGVVDNRPAGDRAARLVIWASQVAEVRTLARGKRFKTQFSINNRKHRGIIKNSPLKPGATPDQPGSLFRQGILNAYLRDLSLHPGRQVEASIASAGSPGKIVLDYLVNESRPWQIFSQVSNFGTAATGTWRGRLGFQDNQLTNHDDILNVDAISTPNFKTYGSFLSYRIPVIRPATLLARAYFSYGDFVAIDSAFEQLHFIGKNWLAGMEFTNRWFMRHGWELQSALGAEYKHYGVASAIVDNTTGSSSTLVDGFSNFLVPFISTRLVKETRGWGVAGGLKLESTVGNYANLSATNGIPTLGRASVDSEWTSLRWALNGTVYLESLFKGGIEKAPYLANEFSLNLRGRVLLRGKRLIPHEEEPMGGALSVRGYDESVLSADTYLLATAEYAYHFARRLKPGEPGKLFRQPFKWRPGQAGETPDWDLIGRVFFDYGYRGVTPAPAAIPPLSLQDQSVNLAGTGVGVEMDIRQNFSIRCDVGMALSELRDPTLTADKQIVVKSGTIHAYIVSTFSW